jgi:hypothetical protein
MRIEGTETGRVVHVERSIEPAGSVYVETVGPDGSGSAVWLDLERSIQLRDELTGLIDDAEEKRRAEARRFKRGDILIKVGSPGNTRLVVEDQDGDRVAVIVLTAPSGSPRQPGSEYLAYAAQFNRAESVEIT